MNVFDLVAKLSIDTSEYESGLSSAKQDATDSGSAISDVFGTVKKTLVGLGVAKVVKDMGTEVFNTGKEFDTAMSQVAATMGTTTDNIQDLRDTAKEMGATTAFTATEAAEGLNYLALAGYSTEQQIAALPTVLNLASAGAMDLGSASDMVTDAMSALGIEVTQSNLETFADQLAKTASSSNTSVAQLGEAILTVGGTAKNMAGGTVEAATALGILADNGIKGAEGGTHLRNILLAMNPTTKAAKEAWKELGISAYDADGKMRPLEDIMQDINKQTEGMSDKKKQGILTKMFNKTDLASVNALLSTTTDRWDELSLAIEGSWYTADSIEETFNSLGLTTEQVTGNLEELGISTEDYNEILATCGGDADTFADMLLEASEEGTTFEDVVNALGGDLDALGTAFDETGGSAEAMANEQLNNVEGSMTLMGSALDGLKLSLWDTFSGVAKDAIDGFTVLIGYAQGFVDEHSEQIKGAIEIMGEGISIAVGWAKDGFNWFMTEVQTDGTFINETVETVKGVFDSGFKVITNGINLGKQAFGFLWNEANTDGTLINGVVDAMKVAFENDMKIVSGTLDTVAKLLTGDFSGAWQTMKETVGGVVENIIGFLDENTGLRKAWNDVVAGVKDMKDDISETWEGIKTTIGNAIETVKGFFDFEWSFPTPKLPHFNVSWRDLGPVSIPDIDVEWYAKAMDLGYMFTQPTVLGNKGFGDAGAEMVIGRDSMMNMITAAQSKGMDVVADKLEKMLASMETYYPAMAEGKVMYNPKSMVAETKEDMGIEIQAQMTIGAW